jgi:hypothetical protein
MSSRQVAQVVQQSGVHFTDGTGRQASTMHDSCCCNIAVGRCYTRRHAEQLLRQTHVQRVAAANRHTPVPATATATADCERKPGHFEPLHSSAYHT